MSSDKCKTIKIKEDCDRRTDCKWNKSQKCQQKPIRKNQK
jgi:hypothetical protein